MIKKTQECDEIKLDPLDQVIVQALGPIVNTSKKTKVDLPTVANNITACQDRCPTIEVWLNEDFEVPVTALVDSGSDISLIGLDLTTSM
uniref:Peptidase A2 domain-containing protein n=1 Tax=Romanomermis culicivorax TaxID=13658 RepID=A0A915JAM6_ROMCU